MKAFEIHFKGPSVIVKIQNIKYVSVCQRKVCSLSAVGTLRKEIVERVEVRHLMMITASRNRFNSLNYIKPNFLGRVSKLSKFREKIVSVK